MRQTTPLTIEHVVVASERPYEQVIAALEARLGPLQDWAALGHKRLPLTRPGSSSPKWLQSILEQAG
jgi:hypothetical protein